MQLAMLIANELSISIQVDIDAINSVPKMFGCAAGRAWTSANSLSIDIRYI